MKFEMIKFSKITVAQLLLLLGLIILLVPSILVRTSFFEIFNFSDKGQIGDTIGGITAPFINAIGAVLVFIAFKEQVKANDLIKEQLYFQHIQEQIHRLEDGFFDLPTIIEDIISDLHSSSKVLNNFDDDNKQISYFVNDQQLNKAIYVAALFQQTADLIGKMDNNKEFMQKKLKTLYKIIYQDNLLQLHKILKDVHQMESSSQGYVLELLFHIQDLQKKFDD